MSDHPFVLRLYQRLSVWLLPRDFYAQQGEHIVRLFEDLYRQTLRERGAASAARLCLRELGSLLRTAAREQATQRVWNPRPLGTIDARRYGGEDRMKLIRTVGASPMGVLAQDVRYAARSLRNTPGFTIVAILTLALCMGANTAIFTVVNSVLLRSLPVPEADRILLMYNSYPGAGLERASTASPDYFDRLEAVDVFEEQALFNYADQRISIQGTPELVRGMRVTPSLFRLLRAQPTLGRIFGEEEGEIGNHQKVILSHALWLRMYGGDGSVLARDLSINGTPFLIVGVMPEEFLFMDPDVSMWTPIAFVESQRTGGRHNSNWEMLGRLNPGATLEQAQAQIDALNATNLELFPKNVLINAGFHTRVVVLQDEVVKEIKDALSLLWGGVLFVLLIGTVNIANLVVVRY